MALDSNRPLRDEVMESLLWLGSVKYVGQTITWIITIFILRLLGPAEFGLMAMAGVVINFLSLITEFGVGTALIQNKDINTDNQVAAVFGLLLIVHCGFMASLWLAAPAFASFYTEPRLEGIIRVLSANFFLISLYVIPQSMLMREMDFKRKSLVDLIAALTSSGITLLLASQGRGVWALVYGNISMQVVSAIGYNLVRPVALWPRFSFRHTRELLKFGSVVTGGRILWYVYEKTDLLIGGRFFGKNLLGNYALALEIASVPLEKFVPILSQVALPAYSKIQSDLNLVSSNFLRTNGIVSLIMLPLFGGLLILTPELVITFLGSKWVEAIIPIQLLCLVMPTRCLYALFAPALIGIGRPDVSFRNVATASIIMPSAFLIGVNWGLQGLCASWMLGFAFVFLFVLRRSLKVLGVTLMAYLSCIRVQILCGVCMTLALYALKEYIATFLPSMVLIGIFPLFGMAIYCSMIFLFDKSIILGFLNLLPLVGKYIPRPS